MEKLEKTYIYGSMCNGGDGSVYIRWFLTKEHAEEDQDNQDEVWGEECIEKIETFVGSKTYLEAKNNSENAHR